MSTARRVPETCHLTGDQAWATLRRAGIGRLLSDSFLRLRRSDGFSHARALAFAISLLVVQATIAVVGFAAAIGEGSVRDGIVDTIREVVPGTAGETLTAAVVEAEQAGASGKYYAITLGMLGAVITGATLMGQLERATNRLYGIEQDRPSMQKYARATALALSAGALAVCAFAALALGESIGDTIDPAVQSTWATARWPIGLLFAVSAIALLFRWSPRREQPTWAWLAWGAGVAALLWVPTTALLGVLFDASTVFGETYGPLAGVVALLLWALLSSIAVLYGAAFAAQLEAVRAGVATPEDEHKVVTSEPDLPPARARGTDTEATPARRPVGLSR